MEAIKLFLLKAVTTPWVYTLLIIAAVAVILRLCYVSVKTKYIGYCGYGRAFSCDGAFAGDEFQLVETVTNPTFIPLFFVKYEFFMPEGLTVDGVYCSSYSKKTSVFHLLPRSTVKKVHTVRSDNRGFYRIENATVVYRKVFYELECSAQVYVYPDCSKLHFDMGTDIYRAGEIISRRRIPEDPFCFAGIREYRAGDPVRSINFKASAHSFINGMRALMTNEYESSRNYDTMILLDSASYSESGFSPEESKEVYETSLNAACYLFCETVKNGGRVGFATNSPTKNNNSTIVPCGSGAAQTKEILECFAEMSYYSQRTYSFDALIRAALPVSPRGVDFYFICTYVSDQLANTISLFRSAGYNIYVLSAMDHKGGAA
ncbi:MAG: DUF58 domain-containing protein [Clostridia bacterium]|nr:DUF58 domain-containing protein [Clostridia bacterium]